MFDEDEMLRVAEESNGVPLELTRRKVMGQEDVAIALADWCFGEPDGDWIVLVRIKPTGEACVCLYRERDE